MKITVRRRSHSGVFANITLGLLPAFVILALASTVQGREAPDIGGASRPCGAEASVGCGYPQQPPERTLREQVEYWERGKASLEQGRYEEAAEAFTAAIEIGPKAGVLFIARGNAYRKLGKPDLALVDYDEAIRMEPYIASGYTNLQVAGSNPALAPNYDQNLPGLKRPYKV